jgi:hypothetical protein
VSGPRPRRHLSGVPVDPSTPHDDPTLAAARTELTDAMARLMAAASDAVDTRIRARAMADLAARADDTVRDLVNEVRSLTRRLDDLARAAADDEGVA